MPGCSLLTSIEVWSLLQGSSGRASATFPIPDLPFLIGSSFYQQAIVPDPSFGNPAGLVISRGARGVIGA
jgi:hypothetical protein